MAILAQVKLNFDELAKRLDSNEDNYFDFDDDVTSEQQKKFFELLKRLKAYSQTQKQDFTILPTTRTNNSEINRQLAAAIATSFMDDLPDPEKKDSDPHAVVGAGQKLNALKEISFPMIAQKLSHFEVEKLRQSLISDSKFEDGNFAERGMNSKNLQAILEDARKEFQLSPEEQVKAALDAYTNNAPKRELSFFKDSRQASRDANIKLAKVLVKRMEGLDAKALGELFSNDSIIAIRGTGIADLNAETNFKTNFSDRGINSSELNAALKLAQSLFPAPQPPQHVALTV